MEKRKHIAILGSTGSIGTQTLDVVREQGDICVTALAAGNNITLLEQQIREFHPALAAVWEENRAKELREKIKDHAEWALSTVWGIGYKFETIPERF